MEDMYSDSDDTDVTSFPVLNTSFTSQADEDTKMTDGMFLCVTQKEEMCTVGASPRFSGKDAHEEWT